MVFLKLLIVAYLVVEILAVVMALAAIQLKPFRAMFIVVGVIMPAIFLYAAVKSLFSKKQMPQFNAEIARVEDDIETERVRLFGGDPTCPSFSNRWERMYQAYLEKLVASAAKTSEHLVSIGTRIHLGKAA